MTLGDVIMPIDVRFREERVPACKVKVTDLRALYTAIQRLSDEAAEMAIAATQRPPDQSTEDFEEIKRQGRELYKTAIVVVGSHGERQLLTDINELKVDILPNYIYGIMFDTGWYVRYALKIEAENRLNIYFDFKRPELIDLSNPSNEPTPNISTYQINARSATWAASATESLGDFFRGHRLAGSWLHSKYAYDAVLVLLGIPMSIWAAYRVGQAFDRIGAGQTSVIGTLVRVYFFLVALYFFRLGFGVLRWVFPYMVLDEPRQNPGGLTRSILGALALALAGTYVVDVVRLLVNWIRG
jgi:hypothetical protein